MSDVSDLLTKNQILSLISDRLSAELTRLRADLAAVTEERDYVMTEGLFSADQIRILKTERDAAIAERDRMREALKPFASPPLYVFDRPLKYVPAPMTEDWIGGGWFSTEDFCRARAAIEGVKENKS